MYLNIFVIYLLMVAAIFFGIAGIVLTIFGIVNKKIRLWLSGSIIIFIALVVFVFGLIIGIKKAANFVKNNTKNDFSYQMHHCDSDKDEEDSKDNDTLSFTIKGKNSDGESFGAEFKFNVKTNDNKEISKKIFPKVSLLNKEIKIEKITNINRTKNNRTIFSVKANFNKPYKGVLLMKAFDYDNDEVAKSVLYVVVNQKTTNTIDFIFENNFDINNIDYFTLSEDE